MDDLIGGRSSDKLHLVRKKVGRYLLSIARLEIHSNRHYCCKVAKRKQYYTH